MLLILINMQVLNQIKLAKWLYCVLPYKKSECATYTFRQAATVFHALFCYCFNESMNY